MLRTSQRKTKKKNTTNNYFRFHFFLVRLEAIGMAGGPLGVGSLPGGKHLGNSTRPALPFRSALHVCAKPRSELCRSAGPRTGTCILAPWNVYRSKPTNPLPILPVADSTALASRILRSIFQPLRLIVVCRPTEYPSTLSRTKLKDQFLLFYFTTF